MRNIGFFVRFKGKFFEDLKEMFGYYRIDIYKNCYNYKIFFFVSKYIFFRVLIETFIYLLVVIFLRKGNYKSIIKIIGFICLEFVFFVLISVEIFYRMSLLEVLGFGKV